MSDFIVSFYGEDAVVMHDHIHSMAEWWSTYYDGNSNILENYILPQIRCDIIMANVSDAFHIKNWMFLYDIV